MNEEQTSYKVTDRRLFNPDGTPRDVPENERPEPTPVKPEAASAPPLQHQLKHQLAKKPYLRAAT